MNMLSNTNVCRQDHLGGGLVGEMLPLPSWGQGAVWLSYIGNTKAWVWAAFLSLCLDVSSKTIHSLHYLQIYLPLKSAQVYQWDRNNITELCTHMLYIPPAIIPSSSYAMYLVHSSSMIIINMPWKKKKKKRLTRSKQNIEAGQIVGRECCSPWGWNFIVLAGSALLEDSRVLPVVREAMLWWEGWQQPAPLAACRANGGGWQGQRGKEG